MKRTLLAHTCVALSRRISKKRFFSLYSEGIKKSKRPPLGSYNNLLVCTDQQKNASSWWPAAPAGRLGEGGRYEGGSRLPVYVHVLSNLPKQKTAPPRYTLGATQRLRRPTHNRGFRIFYKSRLPKDKTPIGLAREHRSYVCQSSDRACSLVPLGCNPPSPFTNSATAPPALFCKCFEKTRRQGTRLGTLERLQDHVAQTTSHAR